MEVVLGSLTSDMSKLDGIVIFLRRHPRKASLFIISVLLGIEMVLSLEQLLNTFAPMDLRVSGSLMDTSPVQFWNASHAMRLSAS